MKRLPKLALTIGDPAGIGPEIAIRAAASEELAKIAEIILYGSTDIIIEASEKFEDEFEPKICKTGAMKFRNVPVGKVDAKCGLEAYNAVKAATFDALAGKVDAIVTAPACKASVNEAGIDFTGHTEFIAELCKTEKFAMMQSSGRLRVVFVSTHISIKDVPASITKERVEEVTMLLYNAIKAEKVKKPLIAMAALNPHAGEDGLMGSEEKDVIIPVIEKLKKKGLDIEGPFPPDTLFISQIRNRFDGIVSMYHDQGHIPFKMLAFDKGVNSTLGLPVIRTSVDHGTAFEIAWKGIADTGSLFEAVKIAAKRASSKIAEAEKD